MQRLTLSPAPFVVLTREVRWHLGLPCGHPHLSSTRGKRARWRIETNIVSCTFCRPDPWSQVTRGITLWLPTHFVNQGENEPVDAQRLTSSSAPSVILTREVRWHAGNTLWLSAPFVNQDERVNGIGMMLVVRFWLFFENFCRCYFYRPETFKSDNAQDSSLLGKDDRVR